MKRIRRKKTKKEIKRIEKEKKRKKIRKRKGLRIKGTQIKLPIRKEEDVITKDKIRVSHMDIPEIIEYLKEKYATYRSLPTVEAIYKLIENYERKKYEHNIKGGKNEAQKYNSPIIHIERKQFHKLRKCKTNFRSEDETNSRISNHKKRSIHKIKRGS